MGKNKSMVNMTIKDLDKIKKKAGKIESQAEKALTKTVKEFKTRGPAWVSRAVREEYNIDGKTIKDSLTNKKVNGTANTSGRMVDNVQLVYEGHKLSMARFVKTPRRIPTARIKDFSKIPGAKLVMKRKAPEGKGVASMKPLKPSKITIEVRKGKQETAKGKHSAPPFLTEVKGNTLVMQRTGKTTANGKQAVEVERSVSVPDAIDGEDVKPKIRKEINEGLGKRLEHYLSRELKNI